VVRAREARENGVIAHKDRRVTDGRFFRLSCLFRVDFRKSEKDYSKFLLSFSVMNVTEKAEHCPEVKGYQIE